MNAYGEVNQLGGVFVNGRPLPNHIRVRILKMIIRNEDDDKCEYIFVVGEDRGVGTARDPALRHQPPVEVIFCLTSQSPKPKVQTSPALKQNPKKWEVFFCNYGSLKSHGPPSDQSTIRI